MSWYIVTLEGFTVQRQTWDTLMQSDGKGDEGCRQELSAHYRRPLLLSLCRYLPLALYTPGLAPRILATLLG